MDRTAQIISNRLSLRLPQKESLEILSELTNVLELKKEIDIVSSLDTVKSMYPTCSDFERDFISVCFALATGVGKTRLMGAFISYLYLEKGIKNFFVLAPNLTIYNKLIEDFSNPAHPKYVFKGIAEFVQTPPLVITGETYEKHQNIGDLHTAVNINVFNISKINAETRKGSEPRIKRLSEFIGDSYFNYLSELDDLVLLMDESHHYRADRGMQVINELKPILGLELTATPQVERAGNPIKFKNVVYEYSLANAIEGGYVKEPAVATRKNFDPAKMSVEEIDHMKLEDGIHIHEATKIGLEIYAKDNRLKEVKPFVLVVAKDTTHASLLKKTIESDSFFKGRYADKVMEIHSNQRGSEKEENIDNLLSLESFDNKIEIVIHVNMLKEGWDVTNLYTIIPLRTAASTTLREQTIGRGLRLPYGVRTGDKVVDRLTIVAHDKFQEIIDEANKPNSIINQRNIINLDDIEIDKEKEVISAVSIWEQEFVKQEEKISAIEDLAKKQKEENKLKIKRDVIDLLPLLNTKVSSVKDLKNEKTVELLIDIYKENQYGLPQKELFLEEKVAEVRAVYEEVTTKFIEHVIEIPRISVSQSENINSGFRDFNLVVNRLNYQPVSEEILVKFLREQADSISYIHGRTSNIPDSLENIIVNELIEFPEIDYDSLSDVLFKLAGQAVEHFKSYLSAGVEVRNVVQYNKKDVARFIYAQMMEHFYYDEPKYENTKVLPFVEIKEHNFSKNKVDDLYPYTETITPTSSIPSKIFVGFKKSCHNLYKFDSKTEKDFAIILEQDDSVLKWLRPAEGQFSLLWHHNSKNYNPDFVVETVDNIYIVETKMHKDIESADVVEKAKAAVHYCKNASRYAEENNKKQWHYLLIPHEAVKVNMSFDTFAKQYVCRISE